MELNHRRLHVGQVSSTLDHGIVLTVTEVGIEPTESRGSRPRRFSCLRTRPFVQGLEMAGSGVAPDVQGL